LALHGQPPRTAHLAVTIDTGQGYQLRGLAAINFQTGQAKMAVSVPVLFSQVTVAAVIADDHVYVTTPNLQSALDKPWVSIPLATPDLSKLALTMAAFTPDEFVLKKLGTVVVVKNGPFTTYSASQVMPLPPTNTSVHLPGSVRVSIAVRTGSNDQISDLWLRVRSGRSHMTIALHVLNYNQPVAITVPPASETQPLPSSTVGSIASGQTPISQLLTPQGIASLGHISVH
jgi:hypothetical protein